MQELKVQSAEISQKALLEGQVEYQIIDSVVFSVTEISQAVKHQVEVNFSNVKVKGEISGLKPHSSGHLYFSLKDSDQNSDAVLNAICWRGTRTKIPLENGIEITAIGRITTYPGRSNYQLIVSDAEISGEGSLLKLLQDRKKKFKDEGLFDKKRELPRFPKKIGVITSPTGAVFKDILHRVADRYPCNLILWPVSVQGNGAAEQISAAIAGFNKLEKRPDVLIVARGGGSIEDLWAFNEECVVRAAFESEIPLISAIGHETDTTLIDYAADVRAPTPTAAAELATPVLAQVVEKIASLKKRLAFSLLKMSETMELRLLRHKLPKHVLTAKEMKLDDVGERLLSGLQKSEKKMETRLLMCAVRSPQSVIKNAHMRLGFAWKMIEKQSDAKVRNFIMMLEKFSTSLTQNSYDSILKKGFCLLLNEAGKLVKSCEDFEKSKMNSVTAKFHDGDVVFSGITSKKK